MTRTSAAVPILVGLALLLSVCVAFATLLATVAAEDAAATPDAATDAAADATDAPFPTEAELLKMKVRDLKALLEKKGPDAACVACTSKLEYAQRIAETRDWPDVQPAGDGPSVDDLFAGDDEVDAERLEKLKESLKASGIDTSKIFSNKGGQFNEEEFAKQFKKWDAMRKETKDEDPPKATDDAESDDTTDAETTADDEQTEL